MSIDMVGALKQAALLRNRVESVLRAAPAPMTGRELADWQSIKEVIGNGASGSSGYGKLSTQLQNMVHRRQLEKIGNGTTTSYKWLGAPPPRKFKHRRSPVRVASEQPDAPSEVTEAVQKIVTDQNFTIRVNKAKRTVNFGLQGLTIVIEY